LLRDSRVTVTLRNQRQNLTLPPGQLRERLGESGWLKVREEVDEARSDRWAEDGLTAAIDAMARITSSGLAPLSR
jgi:hypothetical protein